MADIKRVRNRTVRGLGALLILAIGAFPAFGQVTKTSPQGSGADAAIANLDQVPELFFDEAFAKPIQARDARARITNAVNAANRLNTKSLDGFVRDLRDNRPELNGLPFLMGKDCRMAEERFRSFAAAGESVHQAISVVRSRESASGKPVANAGALMANVFQTAYFEADRKAAGLPEPDGVTTQMVVPSLALSLYKIQQGIAHQMAVPEKAKAPVAAAQVAALMQVLAPESAELRVGLANYLARVPSVDATRALARLAIFSEEAQVRQAACKALEKRDRRDYADILAMGLRYPWPAVAEGASEAITLLKQTEMIPQLISVLEQPDPRAPTPAAIGGKKVYQVRELVRVNHHRNCMLCHAPGNTPDVSNQVIKVAIPVPGEPLDGHRGYSDPPQNPDHVVRLDVTYLRQDFSRHLAVANSAPWPEMQRFDFLVRTRTVTDEEARAYQDRLQPSGAGAVSPFHRAAALALRELTGRDAPEPTAAAWRKLLSSPRE